MPKLKSHKGTSKVVKSNGKMCNVSFILLQ